MKSKNEPIYPSGVMQDRFNTGCNPLNTGLTKREYFAGLVMQAIISNPHGNKMSYDEIAKNSVIQADTLLAELNKDCK